MAMEQIIYMMQELFLIALIVSFPALIVSLIVGILLVGLTIVITFGFTLQQATEFARRMILTAVSMGH